MYIIEYKIVQKFNIYKYFEKCFFKSFLIKNQIIKFLNSQYKKLKKDKGYNLLLKERKELKKQSKSLTDINKKLEERRSYFHLTIKDLYEYVKPMQKKYKNYISSQMAQAICDDCFESFESNIFGKGKTMHYKKYDDIMCLKCKKIDNSFRFKSLKDEDGNKTGTDFLRIVCPNGQEFMFEIDIKDDYELDAFRPNDVKYIQIVRKQFNNYYHYYVQFVTEGVPPLKISKDKGNDGIDIGISSLANVNDDGCMLEDLNPYSEKYEKEIQKCQRSLDRKLVYNNQDKIENGKFKKGSKLKYTNNAKKNKKKLKTLQRKKKEIDKQYKCMLANKILQNCDTIYYEEMNFNALKSKSKKTERSNKSSIIKGKTVFKFKKKRRFGKTIQNKAPSKFLEILKYKGGYLDVPVIPIETQKFKASQYNHQTDKCFKKKLSQRWNMLDLDSNTKTFIQRDLYSAFLIKNTDITLTRPDRNKCIKEFKNFVDNHNKCIDRVKETNNNRLSCFGF